jgi:phage anti-repressor protein
LRLKQIISYLQHQGSSGATLDELKSEFHDEEIEDIKRLINAACDLGEVKKDGKGRGIRYYLVDVEIVKITNSDCKRNSTESKFIENIDVTDCLTTKQKVEKVLSSNEQLVNLHYFEYREKINDTEIGKELYDFMHHGVADVSISVCHSLAHKKNIIYSKNERILNNKIIIQRSGKNGWQVIKQNFECPDRPETQEFSSWAELEKCLKTLLSK